MQINTYPRLIKDDDQPLDDHKLVSECGIQNGTHLRTAKAKHKRVSKGPGSVERRQEKATRLREELKTTKAKMTPEEKTAFLKQLAEDNADDNAEDDTMKVRYLHDYFELLLEKLNKRLEYYERGWWCEITPTA